VTDVASSGRPAGGSAGGTAAETVARLRREIADLERLMVDMPPHHAGGTRHGAEERLDDLRSALQRAERATRTTKDDGGGT
jgi:hypothetical protein